MKWRGIEGVTQRHPLESICASAGACIHTDLSTYMQTPYTHIKKGKCVFVSHCELEKTKIFVGYDKCFVSLNIKGESSRAENRMLK